MSTKEKTERNVIPHGPNVHDPLEWRFAERIANRFVVYHLMRARHGCLCHSSQLVANDLNFR